MSYIYIRRNIFSGPGLVREADGDYEIARGTRSSYD